MGAIRIMAIVLIVAGILGVVYGKFSYTKETHDAKIGSLELSIKDKQTVNVPAWAGVAAIVAGGVLLCCARRVEGKVPVPTLDERRTPHGKETSHFEFPGLHRADRGIPGVRIHANSREYRSNKSMMVITSKVKAEILDEPTLKVFQINVETFKGEVQLSGFVDTAEKVKKAGEIARGVKGVKSVKNNIIVK